ncbi:hypothetical protein OCA8868_01636 [Octadecabacter ascidiaceicola]|uniref:Uncharacterized protein n=2 Tax=Octadecabacter ascidiaceicola TaxID=1655543 RepID=A0A238K584_9RHOB|nr:hypothetical protein OCA8868_01636 [Octadecabacter ascidiaceicola]
MRPFSRKKAKLSEGERARALAFLLVGACSAALGFLAVLHLDHTALFEGFSLYQTWIVIASGLGGVIALFLSGDRMGQSGQVGAIRAVAGAIWVTFIGSLIGGTLGLPFYGTMFGPFIVAVTLMGAPILAMLWAFNLLGIHFLLATYQRERDSIFTPSRIDKSDNPDSLRRRLQGRAI